MVALSRFFVVCAALLPFGTSALQCPPTRFQEFAVAIEIADGRVFIPVFRHEPPVDRAPKTVVIGLHGAGRNGDDYFQWISNSIIKAGLEDDVAVLIPMFPDTPCKAHHWTGKAKYTGDAVMWSHSTRQWVFGQRSDHDGDWDGISSYQVIDDLVRYAETRYRSLTKIVMTGFSAGAQMGLRWSIFSPQGVEGTSLTGIPMTIIMGSPSSVTYLTPLRPAKSCRGEHVTTSHNCTDFVLPTQAKETTCHHNWDQYAFGIDGLTWVSHENKSSVKGDVGDYLHKYVKDDGLLDETLLERFSSKTLVFQFGDQDVIDCETGGCASDCAAMLEGVNRLQRGLNYMAYLRWTIPGYQPVYSTFHGGHRPELFFAGQYFNEFAFNTDGWEFCLWDSVRCFSLLVKAIIAGALFLAFFPALSVFFFMHLHIRRNYVKVVHATEKELEVAKKLLRTEYQALISP